MEQINRILSLCADWMALIVIPADIAKSPLAPWLLVLPPATERECPLGSMNHPRLYDDAAMANMKAAFHDVWDVVEPHAPIWDTISEEELKAAIIRRLVGFAANGTTSRDVLKMKILRSLPLELKNRGQYGLVRTRRFQSTRS